jgi:hypothetical protein
LKVVGWEPTTFRIDILSYIGEGVWEICNQYDESGEDYLYPESYFAAIELSDETRRAIMSDLAAQELRK